MKTPEFFCFGHRGAGGHEPENTVRSVKQALELGANGIEVDVRLADGYLVVIHDETLNRTTSGTGRVADQTFAYLRSLDAGRGERIPTLAEIFDVVNRRAVINVELKGPGAAVPLVRLIEHYVETKGWRYKEYLVSAFDHSQIETVKQLQPKIRTGALIEKAPPELTWFAERLGVWSLHPGKRCVTSKLVADAHRRGLKVFVFTVNQPSEVAAMVAHGVDGVFTDYPDRVVTFLHAQNKMHR